MAENYVGIAGKISPVGYDPESFKELLGKGLVLDQGQITIDGGAGGKQEISYSEEEPEDKSQMWVSRDGGLNNGDSTITTILSRLDEAVARIQELEYGLTVKLDPGELSNTEFKRYEAEVGMEPFSINQDLLSVENIPDEPTWAEEKPNIKHVCIKRGLDQERKDYIPIDGELVYTTDTKLLYIGLDGKFSIISGSGDDDGDGDGGINGIMDYIDLKVEGVDKIYRVKVDPFGELDIYDKREDTDKVPPLTAAEAESQVLKGLVISMIYAGGPANTTKYQPCSHNFVELYNGTDKEICLNGLSLQYSEGGNKWQVFELKGIIPAFHAFTLRGAPCADVLANTTVCKLNEYDQDFPNMVISQTKFKMYLTYYTTPCITDKPINYNAHDGIYSFITGYIDLVGAQAPEIEQANSIDCYESTVYNKLNPNCAMYRTFIGDNVKDKNLAYYSGDTNNNFKDFLPIDYTKELDVPEPGTYYRPYVVKDGLKSMYFKMISYDPTEPNFVSQSFGFDANKTRCFNWISVGYYDEYLQYRKKGTSEWRSIPSINLKGNSQNFHLAVHSRNRLIAGDSTRYTVHKVILGPNALGFDIGVTQEMCDEIQAVKGEIKNFEYRVGKEGGWSPIYRMDVKHYDENSEVRWLHWTDQQAWQWSESVPWDLTQQAIRKKLKEDMEKGIPDYDLIINTGDHTQNGVRPSEWMWYFNPIKDFTPNYPTHACIGNNDLGPEGTATKGKTNPALFTAFYTSEYEPGKVPIKDYSYLEGYEYDYEKFSPQYIDKYLMRSIYNFQIGPIHFCGMNSMNYIRHPAYIDGDQEPWLRQSLGETYNNNPNLKWKIIIAHDAPFSIITESPTSKRACWLNRDDVYSADDNTNNPGYNKEDKYQYSKMFQELSVDAMITGHKHTYSRSFPTIENITDYSTHENILRQSRAPIVCKNTNTVNRFDYFGDYNDKKGVCYFTMQATGFKNISNKEIPGSTALHPWNAFYFPTNTSAVSDVNIGQMFPMYADYRIYPNGQKENGKNILEYKAYRVADTMTYGPGAKYAAVYDPFNPPQRPPHIGALKQNGAPFDGGEGTDQPFDYVDIVKQL